jgi:uncharacterized membrane protein YgaE (UPF0421/DUF939 family)
MSISRQAVVHGVALGLACLISFEIVADLLSKVHSISHEDDVLGGAWAAVAAIFVYRDTHDDSIEAGISRASATFVSFVLCLVYLLFFSFSAVGMAVLIALGVIIVSAAGRPQDSMTVSISTIIILVVAGLAPENDWEEPILRLADTLVGIVIGIIVGTLVTRVTAATVPRGS